MHDRCWPLPQKIDNRWYKNKINIYKKWDTGCYLPTSPVFCCYKFCMSSAFNRILTDVFIFILFMIMSNWYTYILWNNNGAIWVIPEIILHLILERERSAIVLIFWLEFSCIPFIDKCAFYKLDNKIEVCVFEANIVIKFMVSKWHPCNKNPCSVHKRLKNWMISMIS